MAFWIRIKSERTIGTLSTANEQSGTVIKYGIVDSHLMVK